MTSTVNLQAVMAFWAAHLGCSEIQLAQPSTSVVRNGPDLASYRGAPSPGVRAGGASRLV